MVRMTVATGTSLGDVAPNNPQSTEFLMAANHKQNMLDAIAGKPTDRLPWAPRLDLWHNANKLAGTLPDRYRDASLIELVDDLDMGYHAIVPDFRDLRNPEDDIDRALGVYNLWTMPCRTIFENVERTVRVEGDNTFIEYQTPKGSVRATVLYDDSMRKAGITITHVAEYAIKDIRDFEAVGYLFENARVEPNYDGYAEFAGRIGDRGLAAGFVSLAASPMHLIQRELMPMDKFFFAMHDHPDELAALDAKIGVYWDRLLNVAAGCPAELVFVGANYDASVTYPPFFHEHLEPSLKRYADALHESGRFLLTHTDGENTGLLPHYVDADVDVADSICPSPMTRLSFKEVRDFFAGRLTIMGGIPSVALLPSSMPDRDFARFLDTFFEDLGRGDHHILGISDTTPPASSWERILQITQRVKDFGPVRA